MKPCSCRQSCFRSILEIFIATMLITISCGFASAQSNLASGNTNSVPSDSQGNQQAPSGSKEPASSSSQGNSGSIFSWSQFHPGDLKAGVYWSNGAMGVNRNVLPGQASGLLWGPTFAGFQHNSDTSLNDTFVSLEWGFSWSDILIATTSFDTNIGRQTQFTQTSSLSPGQTTYPYNSFDGVLSLNKDTIGGLDLSNKNRIWNLDQCFAFPVIPQLQLLAGWKYSNMNSHISSYSATVPAMTFETLPGQIGWENTWAESSSTSITGFAMAQRFWWTGPYLGVRLTYGTPRKFPWEWHVEGKYAPYVFGGYKFSWDASFVDNAGGFITAQNSTNVSGVHGSMVEIKGGPEIKLIGNLFLELTAKYTYLNMNKSGPESQTLHNSYGPYNPAFWGVYGNFSQFAAQHITIHEHNWDLGTNLVWHF